MNIVALSCFGPPLIITSVDVEKQIDERTQEQKNRN
jgi:hypothetical protein